MDAVKASMGDLTTLTYLTWTQETVFSTNVDDVVVVSIIFS